MDKTVKRKTARQTGPVRTPRKKATARRPAATATKSEGGGLWIPKEKLAEVQRRLREAQETLDAIRGGEVDAVVVSGPHGSQVYSLSNVERPYRVYVERMQEGAVTISADGLILYCNQRFAEMLKLPLEQVISSSAGDYLSQQALAAISGVFGKSEEAVKHECALRRSDESTLPVQLSASALPLDDQTVICLVVTDLTLQRAQEELRLAKEIAEQANNAKDSFLATLSHELRTPLTPALMALVSLGHDRDLSAEAREDVAMIRRNIELETRLIDDLLDLTRIANGKLELYPSTIDLHAVLSRAVDVCRANMDAKQQRIELRLKARQTQTTADPVRLQQVLWNLLRNAIKFTPNGGSISATTSNLPGQKLQLEIKDTGIGFEPVTAGKLFQAFEQRGRGITRQFGGLGLGLAISRSIIEAHGGSIRAHSEGPGTGATFTVILPLRSTSEKPAPSRPSAGSTPVGRGCDILIVEDHADTRETLQRLLKRVGHSVTPTGSGREALEVARLSKFDLVISDLGLPDMSGNELMTQLRKRFRLTGIAISGYGMQDDVMRSREAGFVHHLTKPIEIEQLNALIAKIASMRDQPGRSNQPPAQQVPERKAQTRVLSQRHPALEAARKGGS
jgi:PAS domain S-box-containing protein